MFAMIAGEGARLPAALDMMSRHLGPSGTAQPAWFDERGCCSAAVRPVWLLPEDSFETRPLVDDELVFLCRVRLDKRSDLSDALGLDAHRTAAMSDATLLRHAYRRWGADTPQRVYGEFAFVAWERSSRRLVAATDHVGTVALFYCCEGERLLISTQLAPLVHSPKRPAALDLRSLGLFVANKMGQCWTMFEGIRHLPGGHVLTFQHGRVHTSRWWQPETGIKRRAMGDYVEETRALLTDAVAARLRTTGRLATTLSGGLDSTIVTAMAAKQLACSGLSLEAFTSVPQPGAPVIERGGWDADDTPWARAVAERYRNIPHHLVPPEGMTPLDILPVIHRYSCTPVRNTANMVWIWKLTEQAASMGASVVLTGGFGNLSFSPNGSLEDAALLSPLRVAHFCRRIQNRIQDRSLKMPSGKPVGLQRERVGAEMLLAEFREAHRADILTAEAFPSLRDNVIRANLTPAKVATVDFVAQFGVEWRDPTSDRQLLEYLLTVPQHAFLTGGRSRGLARAVGKDLIPDIVRLRRTRGAQSPDQAAWFPQHAARYRAVVKAMQESEACPRFLSLPALAAKLDILCNGKGTESDSIMVHRALDVGMFVTEFERGAFAAGHAA